MSPTNLSPDKVAGFKGREGRTPPPAPSAAYARRAREIIEDEGGLPGLRATAELRPGEDQIAAVDNGVASGYRRARAGTMPSNLQEAAQRYTGSSDEPTPTTATSTASSSAATYTRTSALSPAYPQTTTRPTLRHAASSAANLETPSAANRLCSGSLTLPGAGLGDAFGHEPFSNAWLANPGLTAASTPARSPLGHPGVELSTYSSNTDSASSYPTDDLNSTLDYLGLADGSDAMHLAPASMSEVRNQAQRAIHNSGPASRLRASTVSNFARPFRPSVTNGGIFGNGGANGYEGGRNDDEEALARAIDNLGMYDQIPYPAPSQLANLYSSGGYQGRDPARPRATTIGALDHPMRKPLTRGNSYLASIPQSPIHAEHLSTPYGYSGNNKSRDSSRGGGPRMSISSHTSRTGTPDVDKGTSTPQVPTRSLWIGNLDVNATSEALLHVFAPYGAIESVRMLPEKTCAFVNFMDKTDAIRARDDVLNRLGGHVAALAETAPVRIGFGKIDSAPNGPSLSTTVNTVAPPPPNLVFTTASSSQTGTSSLPTRALWIGSIPGTTSPSTLLQIFSPFGPVESARVLMNKCCGFVNFERLDSAVSARNALNGRDILGSDVGAIKIGFARVPIRSPTLGGTNGDDETSPSAKLGDALNTVQGAASVSTEQQLSAEGGGLENYRSQLVLDLVKQGVHSQVIEKGLDNDGVVSDQQMIMQVFSENREEDGDVKAAADPRLPVTYYTAIPLVGDRPARRSDSTRLKEIRKTLDAGQCSQAEVDAITHELMEDCAELASDYIGNTVIQKLFERSDQALRLAMLERIAPHLATIGIHKNGTWAAQKIIECAVTPEERNIIIDHLRSFAPPLMCDSLGNYVCAGTLKFGPPWNDYVFDAMIDRLWDIAQNRFGARCMRTCLESNSTTLYQRKRISTGIILNSIPLATNPNGALLLTWLVDTSNLPGRYGLLANRFVSHIAHLCTHKLASLTVLRVMSQTTEPAAANNLLQAIFTSTNDQTLIEILSDANNGSQVIGKILAINSIPQEQKNEMIETVRKVLPGIKASNTPPYRLLLEAVGLPVPAGYINNSSPFGGRNQNHNHHNNHHHNQVPQGWGHAQQSFGMGAQQAFYGHAPSYQQPYAMNNMNNLSPLLIPQNMPLGQSMRNGTSPNSTPNANKSPRTPMARFNMGQGGRMSPGSMMSPGSDPFNPFASPSIDLPGTGAQHASMRLGSALSQPPVTFGSQPDIGGLGIVAQRQGQDTDGVYYGHAPSHGQRGIYGQAAGYQ
uniref:Pumilio domain-containing protein c n=1 Tax=Kwoniella dejecticola CBS 10117 TaxID=1296121 RepID=A0A1A6AG98_9TREE|nr:pumilio domain-containing protein c [Kwoniella dejecticola CBS 10117]OBR89058.1 pumilio domain-containing protein c [Kwoniella dejecticola CBS 10117]